VPPGKLAGQPAGRTTGTMSHKPRPATPDGNRLDNPKKRGRKGCETAATRPMPRGACMTREQGAARLRRPRRPLNTGPTPATPVGVCKNTAHTSRCGSTYRRAAPSAGRREGQSENQRPYGDHGASSPPAALLPQMPRVEKGGEKKNPPGHAQTPGRRGGGGQQ